MPGQATTLIITGYGTNCEHECAYAATQAGADAVTIAHFSELVAGTVALADFNFIIFPGGFLDGDDLGAAQAAAQRWKYSKGTDGRPLVEHLFTAQKTGALILGIGNGFQLLLKLGLLPAFADTGHEQQAALTHNTSGRYEDRWCELLVNRNSPNLFTKGLEKLSMPVRHGQGHFVPKNKKTFEQLLQANLIALQYIHPATGEPTQEYPYNPNGSPAGVAGICDPSGRVFGLMPHPEAYNHETNHPLWTRGYTGTLGLVIFENAVKHLQSN